MRGDWTKALKNDQERLFLLWKFKTAHTSRENGLLDPCCLDQLNNDQHLANLISSIPPNNFREGSIIFKVNPRHSVTLHIMTPVSRFTLMEDLGEKRKLDQSSEAGSAAKSGGGCCCFQQLLKEGLHTSIHPWASIPGGSLPPM